MTEGLLTTTMNSGNGTTTTAAPVKVKIEPGTEPEGKDDPEDFSVNGLIDAVGNQKKSVVKAYNKVFAKANKRAHMKKNHVPKPSTKLNLWNQHVHEFRKQNPHLSFKQCLQNAKTTYKK